MLFGDDVFDVEGKEIGVVLVQLASTHNDGLPVSERRPGGRPSLFALRIGEKLAGFGLEDGDERAERHVVAIFGSLFGSEHVLIACARPGNRRGLAVWDPLSGPELDGRTPASGIGQRAYRSRSRAGLVFTVFIPKSYHVAGTRRSEPSDGNSDGPHPLADIRPRDRKRANRGYCLLNRRGSTAGTRLPKAG